MNCFIYVLYLDASIKYIGVSINPSKRFKDHFYSAFNVNGKEYNLRKSKWIRYHKNEIKCKIIFNGSESECYLKEIELISLARKKGIDLVNLTNGGDKAPKINEHNDPKSTIHKIRIKALGRIPSVETKNKMALAHVGMNSHLDKYRSSDNNPRSFPVVQYSSSGEFIKEWDYAQIAIKELNLNRTAITDCLKGRQKTAGGFIWKYTV